jgi:hypothetical protein
LIPEIFQLLLQARSKILIYNNYNYNDYNYNYNYNDYNYNDYDYYDACTN